MELITNKSLVFFVGTFEIKMKVKQLLNFNLVFAVLKQFFFIKLKLF